MDTPFQETAKVIIDEGLEREFTPKRPRDTRIPMVQEVVSICTGVRRCGKSTLMEEVILQLLAHGVPRENIVCINFADERLLPLQSGGWDALYTAYSKNAAKCWRTSSSFNCAAKHPAYSTT